MSDTTSGNQQQVERPVSRAWIRSEDWLAVLLGTVILVVAIAATIAGRAPDLPAVAARLEQLHADRAQFMQQKKTGVIAVDSKALEQIEKQWKEASSKAYRNILEEWLLKIGAWTSDPREAFVSKGRFVGHRLVVLLIGALLLFGAGQLLSGGSLRRFIPAFAAIFLLAVVAYVLAEQETIKYFGLEYPLWALLVGMVISNTVGTPEFLRPALRGELYIKTGLVLLGAEILLARLLLLGIPGIFVSWVVTPIVLVGTYIFGQRVLRIPSRSLNMVISADMSVCGVSAAIATAAACRAKKEELSLAISISLMFTTIMMVAMPALIRWVGMNEVVGGAWIGGTIDSTGAVVAAGGMLGKTALEVAATVKMIQNTLIGIIAFAVSVYWVTCIERGEQGMRLPISEIWIRFPKFVLGFLGASLVFSAIYSSSAVHQVLAQTVVSGSTSILRGWCFCLAFVCIGLETNFRALSRQMQGGKPLILYVCGQAFNLALTLLAAWLMFEKVFPQVGSSLAR